VSLGHAAAVAAVRTTRTVPVVFSFAIAPVGSGLVSSFAKPGGNVTGHAVGDDIEESFKVFDFVREAAPSARRWGTLIGDINTLAGYLVHHGTIGRR
jgi:putative ABC transport system substrate-binding protein